MIELKGVISVDKLKVRIFVEDIAQETIIKRIFIRLCEENGLDSNRLDVEVPYSKGGGSIKAMSDYLKDFGEDNAGDCFVLGSDGNCKGFTKKRNMLEKNVKQSHLLDKTIFAIPDPHIERWYLVDENALSNAVGERVAGNPPGHKCDKGFYKNLLKSSISKTGVIPMQGGAEFGADVGNLMDFYKAGKQDQGLKYFVESVRNWAIRNR
jgi:hypothetical protein